VQVPFTLATLARRGLLNPGRPSQVARQFIELLRWGFGLGGEVRSAAARDPDRPAVIDEHGTLSYRELLADAERTAGGLRGVLGLRAGDRIGLLCRNHAGLVRTMVAASLLGVETVLINTGLSPVTVAAVARAQRLRVLGYDAEFAEHAALLPREVVGLDEAGLARLRDAAPPGGLPRPEREGRIVMLTSGTTGVPKGARRPTPSGFAPLAAIISRIPLRTHDRVLIAAPLFHAWGFAGLQVTLALRGTAVLRRRFDPLDVARTIAGNECEALLAVPVMLQRLLEAVAAPPDRPPGRLRVVAASGSALAGGLATRFMDAYGDVLYNLYGSTEASWVSIATPAELRRAPGTAGRPPAGTRVVIRSQAGERLPPGRTGRILVGNDMLFEGYTHQEQPGLAESAARRPADGLLATGDLGHLDSDGLLYVDGREDDLVVSGGENVLPAAVEDLLAGLPQVREVAVVGVPDPSYGARLAAWIVLRPGEALDPDAVREYVRRNLARFAVPRDVWFVAGLPRNATGKVVAADLGRW
jgi:acyl-CoA synthetase (AMP-forming)/AMP-acid ligase II